MTHVVTETAWPDADEWAKMHSKLQHLDRD